MFGGVYLGEAYFGGLFALANADMPITPVTRPLTSWVGTSKNAETWTPVAKQSSNWSQDTYPYHYDDVNRIYDDAQVLYDSTYYKSAQVYTNTGKNSSTWGINHSYKQTYLFDDKDNVFDDSMLEFDYIMNQNQADNRNITTWDTVR